MNQNELHQLIKIKKSLFVHFQESDKQEDVHNHVCNYMYWIVILVVCSEEMEEIYIVS